MKEIGGKIREDRIALGWSLKKLPRGFISAQ